MGRRIDYYDDPEAPAANSLVPSANVVVTNDAGQVLMIKRSDNDNWAVPGGAMELGESLVQAAVRETREKLASSARSLASSASIPIRSTSFSTPVTGKFGRSFRSSLLPGRSGERRRRAARAPKFAGKILRSWPTAPWTGLCGCGSTISLTRLVALIWGEVTRLRGC